MITYPSFKVAAMHVSPVFLDTEKTVDKVCALIDEAASAGAELIVFPEAFVPAFPLWSSVRAPIFNHDFFRQLASNAVRVPGPEVKRVAQAAKRHNVTVSLGINEGTDASVGCIWNTNIIIGPNGVLLSHHRKIVPTYFEKLTWANGDGAGLRVVNTPLGKLGMLICGENSNPLARFALMAQGEQVHIANYPPLWPNGGNYDIVQSIRARAQAHSIEAKAFTVVSSAYLTDDVKELIADGDKRIREVMDNTPRSASMVIGPNGEQMGEIRQNEEGIIYADINIADCVVPKQFHDVVGYYNRFDIFKLTVNRSSNDPINFDAADQERGTVNTDLAAFGEASASADSRSLVGQDIS